MTNQWSENWEVVDELPPGGHGYAHKVRRCRENDACLYVLKTLKNQASEERRARMYAEAAALKILDHPCIARYVESNTDHHADKSIGLYVVTEYIEGIPMSSIASPS